MKTVVVFRGKEYTVPHDSKWLAIDGDGWVFVYTQDIRYLPYLGGRWWFSVGDCRLLCAVTPPKDASLELYELVEDK
jgi:hypothetical protein